MITDAVARAIVAESLARTYSHPEALAFLTLAIDENWATLQPAVFDAYEQVRAGTDASLDPWFMLHDVRAGHADVQSRWEFKRRLYAHIHDAAAAYDAANKETPVTDPAAVLANAMGSTVSLDRYRQLLPAFSSALEQCDCTTINRVAMFCAQVGHESVGLKYMTEIGGDAYFAKYNGRTDLGNTQPGDGPRFRGRGPIQVTGRHNYTRLSTWAHAKGLVPSPTFFVDQPTQLASDQYGFLGVVWYWTTQRPMNSYSDRGDILGATKAVNGGTNGLQDRTNRWNRCRAMGDDLLSLVEDWTSVLNHLMGIQ